MWTSVVAKKGKATTSEKHRVRGSVRGISKGMSKNEPIGCDGQLSPSGEYVFSGVGKRKNASPTEEVEPSSEEQDAKRAGTIVEQAAGVGERETGGWKETDRVFWEWVVEAVPRGRAE